MIEQLEQNVAAAKDKAIETISREPDDSNAGIEPMENALAFAAAIGATFLARQALQATWKTTLNRTPPKNPASPEVDWKDALLWGAVSGALVGVVRIASRRGSSAAYQSLRS